MRQQAIHFRLFLLCFCWENQNAKWWLS